MVRSDAEYAMYTLPTYIGIEHFIIKTDNLVVLYLELASHGRGGL